MNDLSHTLKLFPTSHVRAVRMQLSPKHKVERAAKASTTVALGDSATALAETNKGFDSETPAQSVHNADCTAPDSVECDSDQLLQRVPLDVVSLSPREQFKLRRAQRKAINGLLDSRPNAAATPAAELIHQSASSSPSFAQQQPLQQRQTEAKKTELERNADSAADIEMDSAGSTSVIDDNESSTFATESDAFKTAASAQQDRINRLEMHDDVSSFPSSSSTRAGCADNNAQFVRPSLKQCAEITNAHFPPFATGSTKGYDETIGKWKWNVFAKCHHNRSSGSDL
jgi:hypothetical protein